MSLKKKAIEEPGNERVIKGPKEGFVEDISVNKGLSEYDKSKPSF